MLLLSLAIVGATFAYETHSPIRVLIHRAYTKYKDNDAKEGEETKAISRVIASLRRKNIEVIDVPESNELSRSSQVDDYPAAAIFVTDGSMRAADVSDEIESASVATGGGPVFVVTDIQKNGNPRVALNDITVMNRPVRGVPIQVNCFVHAQGMRGRKTLVTISDDAQVRVSAEAHWASDDDTQVLSLEVVPKVAGWVNYLARVEAAGGEDPETLLQRFTIFAGERHQRVLVIEGEPTWEAKFIRRALEKTNLFDVDYFAQISRSAVVGIRDEQEGSENDATKTQQSDERGSPNARFHEAISSAVRLNTYDCIILGATPDAFLSVAEAARVGDWLERRGGGLIVLGGNNFAGSIVAPRGKLGSLLPAEIDSSSFRSDSETLSRNTPVVVDKSRGQFVLSPTDAGQAGALRSFTDSIEGNVTKPALSGDGLRIGRLRPGATVLAFTGQVGERETKQDAAPLIAAMRYGAGRAIVFAPSDSWRMRATESGEQANNDGPFASLWQGLTLWAGSGAHPPVEIVMSDDSPEAGDEATAEIRVRDESYAPLTIENVSARLQQLAETEDSSQTASFSQEIPFTPDRNDPSIWRAHFAAPPVGKFAMQIEYTAKGKNGSIEKYFATVPPSSIEKGASRDTLQRVTRGTGGDLFSVVNLDPLNDKVAALPKSNHDTHRTIELRSWWPMALIITLLLSCEWLIIRLTNRFRVAAL